MLQRLLVRNLAVIDEVEIEFQPHLNIITGETGAGKSILVGALGLVLGSRADVGLLRAGKDRAVVEAEFNLAGDHPIFDLLSEHDLASEDNLLLLRRELLASGRSRAFVNDIPVPASLLQEIGDRLVDLHGQHEHQTLLRPSTHIVYLDEFSGLRQQVAEFGQLYRRVGDLQREVERLRREEQTLRERRELFEFQLREIDAVKPSVEEEDELTREEQILSNVQRLQEETAQVVNLLYEGEGSALDSIAAALRQLERLGEIDAAFGKLASDLEQARVAVDEVAKSVLDYRAGIDADPARLEQVRNRLAEYTRLKKRYGASTEEVLRYRDKIAAQLSQFQSMSEQIEALEDEIASLRSRLAELSLELSERRRSSAGDLEKAVQEKLAELGMPGSVFRVVFREEEDPSGIVERQGVRYRTGPRGTDIVEFYISTNPGQEARPLAKVASGGEISRVMLALKSVLATCDPVPTMIFDEIDMGVSGRVAQAVGRSLRELAEHRQILCITHLPQIASQGHAHFLVEKIQKGDQTRTVVRRLDRRGREEAIARLLSGERLSETHLRTARELLAEAGEERTN